MGGLKAEEFFKFILVKAPHYGAVYVNDGDGSLAGTDNHLFGGLPVLLHIFFGKFNRICFKELFCGNAVWAAVRCINRYFHIILRTFAVAGHSALKLRLHLFQYIFLTGKFKPNVSAPVGFGGVLKLCKGCNNIIVSAAICQLQTDG